MTVKDFKKGMDSGAKPFEEKFRNMEENFDSIHEKLDKNSENFSQVTDDIIDILEDNEKKALYDLNTVVDISELDPDEGAFLLAILYTLANEMEVTQYQQDFIRSVKNYLKIENPQTSITLDRIENIESINAQKAMLQTIMELLFLNYASHDYFDDYEEVFSYFSVNKRGINEIQDKINAIYKATGLKGIAENYGYVPVKNNGEQENDFWDDVKEWQDEMGLETRNMRLSCIKLSLMCEMNLVEINNFSCTSVFDFIDTPEMKEELSAGNIKNSCVAKALSRATDAAELDGNIFAVGIRYVDSNDYLFFFLNDGLFLNYEEQHIFIEYSNIHMAEENSEGLTIKLYSEYKICTDELQGSKINEISIERNDENSGYLRAIRKYLEKIIGVYGGYLPDAEKIVENTIEDYITKISKSSPVYKRKDFEFDDKNEKKLLRALAKYALKVRKDDAIAFVDTSLMGNGSSGILLAKDGIAFDYAFEKIFAKYEEIVSMTFNRKGNTLTLHGDFAERKDNSMVPSINDIYYHLPELKKCIEEIRYCI